MAHKNNADNVITSGDPHMDISVIWPDAASLDPKVEHPYIDIHGILEKSLDLALPEKWVGKLGDPDAPSSSNLLFNSMHGLGKTLLVATLGVELSKRINRPIPMVVYDCSEDTRNYHLIGSTTLQADGSTAFVPGPFPLAIEMANREGICVLCAEEISALTPGAQKQFNSMTDWRNGIFIPQLGTFMRLKRGARVIIAGTMNPSAYGGVYSLNADLRSRFDESIIPVPSMEQEQEILSSLFPGLDAGIIEKAAQLAKDTRSRATDYKLSTRDLVHLLNNYRKLGKMDYPLELVANKFDGSDRNMVADRIHAIFSVTVPKLEA